jgi:site-specific DNA recombinase
MKTTKSKRLKLGKSESGVSRAVIYCRVSTKEQTQNLSLATQEKQCRGFCKQHQFAVAEVFIERGESAKTAERTKFKEMLAYLRENKGQVQQVVVYSISRFARSIHDHLSVRNQIGRLGITLRSVTEPFDDSSTGKLMESILASFAQFDNDVRAERTVAGMQAAMEKGRWTFKPPLGYRSGSKDGPSILPDDERSPLVKEGFRLMSTGLYSQPQTLDMLRKRGLRTLKGKPVSTQTFSQMLRKPIYAGWIEVDGWGDRVKGDFEPLVDQDTFDTVQAVLDGKRPTALAYQRNHPDFPLRQFVKCGFCGRPLTGSSSTGRNKRRYAYYHCHAKECKAVRERKDDLERAFLIYLKRLQPKPGYLQLFNEIVLDVWRQKQRQCLTASVTLQANLDELNQNRERLEEAFLYDKVIDQQTYDRQKDKLDESLMLVEMDLRDAKASECDVEGVLNYAQHVISNAGRLWIEFNLEQKQRFQRVLFPQGVTFKDGEFGTDATCLIFKLLQRDGKESERVATPTGFEPVLPA